MYITLFKKTEVKTYGSNWGPTYNAAPLGAAAYETPAQGPRLHYQSVGIRFAANLVDGLVLGLITWILMITVISSAFASVAPVTSADQINATVTQIGGALSAGIATALLIIVVVWFLYYTLLEGRYGQTLDKWLVKVKVVKENGAPIDYGDAAVRTILRIIDGLFNYLIGAILIWTSDKKQRLGDRLAHTVVIQLCDVE
ncbi:MAG: RDD family protein [Euryarchaeota archaeon]